jgi:hypothetical protein
MPNEFSKGTHVCLGCIAESHRFRPISLKPRETRSVNPECITALLCVHSADDFRQPLNRCLIRRR